MSYSEQADDAQSHIGASKPERVAPERARDANGEQKRDGRCHQRNHLNAGVFSVRGIQRPRELRPRPPDEPEHEKRGPRGLPVNVTMEKCHNLCDAVDEDQIEEELDEGDLLVVRRDDEGRV